MAARLIYFGLPISLFARIPHEFNDPLVTFLGADIIYWNDRIVTLLGWYGRHPRILCDPGASCRWKSELASERP
jgi:hypothetical protein